MNKSSNEYAKTRKLLVYAQTTGVWDPALTTGYAIWCIMQLNIIPRYHLCNYFHFSHVFKGKISAQANGATTRVLTVLWLMANIAGEPPS
jgi:hypothetical protein